MLEKHQAFKHSLCPCFQTLSAEFILLKAGNRKGNGNPKDVLCADALARRISHKGGFQAVFSLPFYGRRNGTLWMITLQARLKLPCERARDH